MSTEVWEEPWSPHWAPHVSGRYTKRVWDKDAKMHEEQRIEMACSKCGATWKTTCASGHVRDHIVKFGHAHLHRDALTPPEGTA